MAEELVPIQKNDYNELLLQTVAVIDPARIKVTRYNAAIASNSYCEIGKETTGLAKKKTQKN